MGLFGKKVSKTLPLISERTIKFAKDELQTYLWSSAGESSPNQNKTHRANTVKVIEKCAPKKSDRDKGTAHLIPEGDRVLVQMFGLTVDELTPESITKVGDRLIVENPVPVECRVEIYSRGRDSERANTRLDPKT